MTARHQAEQMIRAGASRFYVSEHAELMMFDGGIDDAELESALLTGDVVPGRGSAEWHVTGDDLCVSVEVDPPDHVFVITCFRP